MKICPVCRKTYSDENLNFCLEDGTLLTQSQSQPLPETVLMNQPRMTDPNRPHGMPQSAPTAWSAPPQQFPVQQKKSSKTWLWVVGILGLVVLLCGGGFAGLAVIGLMNQDTGSNTQPPRTNTRVSTTPAPSTPTSSTPTGDDTGDVQNLDLSGWVQEFSLYGTTEYTDGELLMASKQKRFYYVVLAGDEYTSQGADIRVTLRNVDNADSSLGYGLIVHSNPSPLVQDYGFLIDAKQKRYRIVRHEPQDEKSMVPWTKSSIIKDGTQENTIEAKDTGDKTEFYINGQLVNSVSNSYAYKGGVPGLYSGDGVKIAFKNLEIRK